MKQRTGPVTADEVEHWLDICARVATHCTPRQKRRLLSLTRNLEASLVLLRNEEADLARLQARLKRPSVPAQASA